MSSDPTSGLRQRSIGERAPNVASVEDRLVEAKNCNCPSVIKKLANMILSFGRCLESMIYDRISSVPARVSPKIEPKKETEEQKKEEPKVDKEEQKTEIEDPKKREKKEEEENSGASSSAKKAIKSIENMERDLEKLLQMISNSTGLEEEAVEEEAATEEEEENLDNKKPSVSSSSSSYSSNLPSSSSSSSSSSSRASARFEASGKAIRKAKLEELYKNGVIFRLPETLMGVQGIQGAGNSCTIASLLFNMFAATDVFDEILLVGQEKEAYEAKAIREQLIKIVNILRSPKEMSLVSGNDLVKLRELVMGTFKKGAFLQPDEFLQPLFEKLNISWKDENEFNYYSIVQKDTSPIGQIIDQIIANFSGLKIQVPSKEVNMLELIQRENQIRERYEIAANNILKTYQAISEGIDQKSKEYFELQFLQYQINGGKECKNLDEFISLIMDECEHFAKKKIKSDNKILFIQMSSQNEGGSTKAYNAVVPSLYFSFEGQNYRLQSVLAHEHDSHYASWVNLPQTTKDENKMYYFNGGGGGIGISEVVPLPKLDELLFGADEVLGAKEAETEFLLRAYTKLIADGAFFIYIRDEE